MEQDREVRAMTFIMYAIIHLSMLKENNCKEAEYESNKVANHHISNIIPTDEQPNNSTTGYTLQRRDSSTREGKKHTLVVLNQNSFFISTMNRSKHRKHSIRLIINSMHVLVIILEGKDEGEEEPGDEEISKSKVTEGTAVPRANHQL